MAGPWLRRLGAGLLLCSLAAAAAELPPEVTLALQRAKVPLEAVSVVVQESGSGRVRVDHRGGVPVNPASLTKLLTTDRGAGPPGPGLDLAARRSGSAARCATACSTGRSSSKGSGDPKLVLERVWLLLRRLQQMGVREIRGDIVLDSSAFVPEGSSPATSTARRCAPTTCAPTRCCSTSSSVILQLRARPGPAWPGDGRAALAGHGGGHAPSRWPQGPCGDWRAA
jgi:D-alanyl-D-alanine carboxypeptidase/D-alanyl-D-alanine-endopeptidase (penicillin-binding protein 4)